MKIAVVITLIILGIVGFFFYGFISDEIEQFNANQYTSVKESEIVNITVDNKEIFNTYSQRKSTYPDASKNIIKDFMSINIETEFAVGYYMGSDFVLEEWTEMPSSIQFDDASRLIIKGFEDTFNTTAPLDWFENYIVEGESIIVFSPKNNGPYKIFNDDLKIEVQINDYRK